MNQLPYIKKKLVSLEELSRMLAIWNFQDKRIVFTNGCFDIIHRGHVEYLTQSATQGDVLIIGLHSDQSVKRLKGKNRPIQDYETRALILSSFSFVSAVISLDEDSPYELIKHVKPNVLVKGADKLSKDIVGYDVVSAKGGRVITIDMVEGHSTDMLLEKIRH